MKAYELRNKNNEELTKELKNSKKELFNLRFQHKMSKLTNLARFKVVRTNIAKIRTIMNERNKDA